MKRALLLLLFASLLLLPGCLSEAIKTADECTALEATPPASKENWAGTDPSQYQNAWAYEKISCWHDAAIWYAINGDTMNASESCNKIYSVDWPVEDFRDDERNICICDIAEKLEAPSLCVNIPNTVDNAYLRNRCETRAQNAADKQPICSGTIFILAGLGAFLFSNSRIRK